MKKYMINIFLIIAVSIVTAYILIGGNSYQKIIHILQTANYKWVFFGLLVMLLSIFCTGCILRKLLLSLNRKYSYTSGFINSLIANFFHGITPSSSGGQFAQVYVFSKQNIPVQDSASVLFMDFIIYQSTMIGVVLCLILLRFAYFRNTSGFLINLVLLGFLVNASIIFGLLALVKSQRFYHWLIHSVLPFLKRIKLLKNDKKSIDKINDRIRLFETTVDQLKRDKGLILYCIIMNTIKILLFYSIPIFCAYALNIPVLPQDIVDIIALSSFVAMINAFIPLPGSSGGIEASFMMLFTKIFPVVQTSAILLLFRSITYYMILILGGITFLIVKWMPEKKGDI